MRLLACAGVAALGGGTAIVLAGQSDTPKRSDARPGLVAYYAFNDSPKSRNLFADRSGGHRPAVGRNVRRAAGKFGRGLGFNGRSSSLSVANRPSLDLTTGMTLEAWVKPQAKDGKRPILARIGRGGNSYAVLAATPRGGMAGEAQVGRSSARVGVSGDLPLGKWTHVALTYDGARMRLFQNAGEVASTPVAGAIDDSKGPLRIGGRVYGGGWFKGIIDEVRVYSRALGAAEIRKDMKTRPAKLEPSAATAPPAAPGAPGASGVPAPSGDLPGWRQIFLDDFTQNVSSWGNCSTYDQGRTCASLPEPYRSKWWAYPTSYQDTREKNNGDGGFYDPRNLSMQDGLLKMVMRRENGTTQAVAPSPKVGPRTYGRFAIRWRMDPTPGYKVAWMLWRASGSWGEIDFPEGDLDGTISAFMHKPSGQDAFTTRVAQGGSAWHTSVVEWTPGKVQFFLDDQSIGTSTSSVPDFPMNWLLQSETSLDGPPANGSVANIYVDWVAAWAPA